MSGLEIVGVVLGAFPIVIEALKAYREVSSRLHLFHEIRIEYTKCEHNLRFYQASFKSTLRQLLRSLIEDDDTMNHLLSNSEGSWVDQQTAGLLRRRLGEEIYQLLIDCIEGIKDVMAKLNHDLGPDSALKQHLQKPLFEEFGRYDSQLIRLVGMIDDEAQSTQAKIPAFSSSQCSTTLCSIWAHANALFKALSSAWACCCYDQHLAELLLQHRTTNKNEFNMLFAKRSPSSWHIQKALITVGSDPHCQKPSISGSVDKKATVQPPQHLSIIPKYLPNARPKVACASIPAAPPPPDQGIAIFSLCRLSHQQTERFDSVAIDQILRKEVLPLPSRRQRYSLSVILASSFLQLLDTPWLPNTWRQSDIVFFNDEKNPRMFRLDQPYLKREFLMASGSNSGQQENDAAIINNDDPKRFHSLGLFGIVLLELCFGQPLEEHHCRKQWPTGDDELQKCKLDIIAARQWSNEVYEEAGHDFDEAIKWCFERYLDAPPENWRQEMMQHVVQPLERSLKYLSG
ncbi:hypothetical protein F4779DRAFT_627716 [Xylariaceae sp. FL0662B]|nr:hypothetical protein F4779DRAFT_627716 [Xylariaceae sp. FL0662B]